MPKKDPKNARGTLRRRNIDITANMVLNGIASVLPSAHNILFTRKIMLNKTAGTVVAVSNVFVFQLVPFINL